MNMAKVGSVARKLGLSIRIGFAIFAVGCLAIGLVIVAHDKQTVSEVRKCIESVDKKDQAGQYAALKEKYKSEIDSLIAKGIDPDSSEPDPNPGFVVDRPWIYLPVDHLDNGTLGTLPTEKNTRRYPECSGTHAWVIDKSEKAGFSGRYFSESTWVSNEPNWLVPVELFGFFALLSLCTFCLEKWLAWVAKDE
jgi:hypothetical protein